MDFFPIIVGHYLQILKEAMGLGHGLAMAANIHKRPLDIVSLLIKEHTTTCEGLCSPSPNPDQEKKKKECNSLAKMFVFFHVADTVHSILQKTQANVGQTNSDKNNLNNNLEFGKVNTISKLQIQDTP